MATPLQYCKRGVQTETALVTSIWASPKSWAQVLLCHLHVCRDSMVFFYYKVKGWPIRNSTCDIWTSPKNWAQVLLCHLCVWRDSMVIFLLVRSILRKYSNKKRFSVMQIRKFLNFYSWDRETKFRHLKTIIDNFFQTIDT